jgi:S-DNA-T family DNA segregation ATPase FtsK/SpoIIIE
MIGMILFSVLFAYVSGSLNQFLGSGPGGSHGYFISRLLIAYLGVPGTGFLLLTFLLAFLIFAFKGFLPSLTGLFRKKVNIPDTDLEINPVEKDEDIATPEYKTELPGTDEEDDLLHFETRRLDKRAGSDPSGLPMNKVEMTVESSEDQDEGENPYEYLPDYDPKNDLSSYKYPPLSILKDYESSTQSVSNEELLSNKNKIVETLANYKITIDKIKATIGPTVTLYEIVPAPGIRISKIKNLEDDIALSLSALGIRIIAPIPGRGTIGIEVPNQQPKTVSMRNVISSKKFQECEFELPVALGKTISNETYVFDLTRMPHLLVAGATGQGKSVGLNAILISLLYRKHPAQLKLVLIDPKKVELTLYAKIERHFLAKLPDTEEAIITDTQKVINTMNSLTKEMDNRYTLLKQAHVRNIIEYNDKFIKRKLNPDKGHRYLPYIVLVIDEFADLIMTAGREIENPIARLAQLARAVGIHLIIATQRPTTNIITGVIKANFPARIAFRVLSVIDSRTILDVPGANQLIGRGDMLISAGSEPVRLQCAFMNTSEIDELTEFIGNQRGYPSAHLLPEADESSARANEVDLKKRDSEFEKAARLVVQYQQGSTSLIQRKLSLGYNRAGRIVDQLEAAGILGPFEGSKARDVLIQDEASLEQILKSLE